MSGRPGSRRDHDLFCRAEQWDEVRNARGGKIGRHLTYELRLPDGRVLRTLVSRPPDSTTYGPSLWKHILTTQLEVTEAEFWTCVDDGRPPDRGGPAGPPAKALPASLVHQLIHVAGVAESEVAEMSLERAVEVMAAHWSRPAE